jgi:hypothetical protein
MDFEDVLELMHLASRRYATIEARLRRRFEQGSAEMDDIDRREPSAAHPEEGIDHLWFSSTTRWRVEAEAGPGKGLVRIQNQERDLRNFRFEDLGEGFRAWYLGAAAVCRQVLWEPNILIPEMWFEVGDADRVAGRAGVHVRADPRPTSHDFFVTWPPADRYELTVDLERGILLRLIFLVRDKVVMSDEVLDVKFDEPLPAGALSLDDGG